MDRESALDAAVRIARCLDRTVLAIQVPPGSGRTYAGAHMIRALVNAGKRVGVTANSHKVVCHLLEEVRDQAAAAGERIGLARKGDAEDEELHGITLFENNQDSLASLADDVQVLGGTSWLWARADAKAETLMANHNGDRTCASTTALAGEDLWWPTDSTANRSVRTTWCRSTDGNITEFGARRPTRLHQGRCTYSSYTKISLATQTRSCLQ